MEGVLKASGVGSSYSNLQRRSSSHETLHCAGWWSIRGIPKIRDTFFADTYGKDYYRILGSILGSPYFEKLPFLLPTACSIQSGIPLHIPGIPLNNHYTIDTPLYNPPLMRFNYSSFEENSGLSQLHSEWRPSFWNPKKRHQDLLNFSHRSKDWRLSLIRPRGMREARDVDEVSMKCRVQQVSSWSTHLYYAMSHSGTERHVRLRRSKNAKMRVSELKFLNTTTA